MATYVIGDVQGCFTTLTRLLARIQYDRTQDRLWLAGDLVNRGPRSLDTLRWAVEQGDRLVAVLGNHDVHLLLRAAGLRKAKERDTLDDVLAAPDRDDLLRWLRTRPVVHHQAPYLVVHAGLWPSWTLGDTLDLARAAEKALVADDRLLEAIAAGPAPAWDDGLSGRARLCAAMWILTGIRMVDARGRYLKYSGAPGDAPDGAQPWYGVPGRRSAGAATVLFGHWAAHGFADGRPSHVALDSGCVWGQALTAVRLDDFAVFQEPAADGAAGD